MKTVLYSELDSQFHLFIIYLGCTIEETVQLSHELTTVIDMCASCL